MYGSFWGTVLAVLYLAVFLTGGVFISNRVFYKEAIAMRALMGAVLGSFALQWLPALSSFVFGFNLLSHLAALVLLALAVLLVGLFLRQRGSFNLRNSKFSFSWLAPLILMAVVFVYFYVTLDTHTIPLIDGAMHTGQCTYGDMNMHLGFITSIARQGMFPPEYSILPGTKLCYPFLCDTISSSLYLFGSSLRFAYMAPMLLAAGELFLGFYLFAKHWLKDNSKAVLAWVLFFLCGGFGFIYFMDGLRENPDNFLRIFTEFYQTPTNLVDEGNIRWVNIIVDMLIPQRATLFGWAILFPTLLVLYKAVFDGEKRYFIIGGILAGGMTMIHTHSFLALGLICACWLMYVLVRGVKNSGSKTGKPVLVASCLLAAIPALLGLAYLVLKALSGASVSSIDIAMPVIGLVAGLVLAGIILLIANIINGTGRELAGTWLPFLVITLALALPQLVTWTFSQVSGGSMLRGYFNWANINDSYIWFYVKNIGIVALLALPALFAKRKTLLKAAAPALIIFFVCEFVVFQPNVYDNNKLLYVAYALVGCVVASYMVDIYRLLAKNKVGGRVVIAGITVFLCVFSAVLTMGREVVSDYELYGKDQVAAAEFIENNTPADAVILTNTRHNNAVSSLTGRNIVCGAGTFLYFHGVDYQGRENDVKTIYNNIASSGGLLKQYNVDYIFVSAYERGSYSIDQQSLESMYRCIYEVDGVSIYAVSKRAVDAIS